MMTCKTLITHLKKGKERLPSHPGSDPDINQEGLTQGPVCHAATCMDLHKNFTDYPPNKYTIAGSGTPILMECHNPETLLTESTCVGR
ncbi:unnamed protein product [Prunus armeniaca]